MAKRSTSNDRIRIDPLFPIPEGAEEQFVYTRQGTDTDSAVTQVTDSITGESVTDAYEDPIGFEYDDGYDDRNELVLQTPDTFSVVSQRLRRAPGGQQVVDVVIEVEGVPGAINYEIQVVKI